MPSDYGHEQTDKLLKELENRIDKEYSQAAKEVQEKFYAHMKDFERKDAKMQEKLDAGKITETEYQNWRTNQMLTGQRMNALYDNLAKDLVNADQIAAGMINDSLPDVYALNMNYSTYKIEHTTEIDTNFTLYDRKTVENLMKDNPRIIPRLTEKQAARIKKDELWNRQHLVSAVAQGILQGEGIPDIAKRLQTVAAMDDNAATRNARTYITAAQNKGRIDSYERAEKLGIKTNKKWIATLDDRTRVEHRHLDGVSIPYSDVFKMDGYEIEYPGDPSAEPEMIYNCRCTLVDDILDWPYNDERNDEKLGDMTYEQWKHAKDKPGKDGSTKQDAEIRAEKENAKAVEVPEVHNKEEAKEELLKVFGNVEPSFMKNDEELIVRNTNQFLKLNARFGAVTENNAGFVTAKKSGRAIAWTDSSYREDREFTRLGLVKDFYKDKNILMDEEESGQRTFFSMPCAKENLDIYSITHEYGHILESYISRRREDWDALEEQFKQKTPGGWIVKDPKAYQKAEKKRANEIYNEIIGIAKEKNSDFNLEDNLSKYGHSNKFEFFAEVFANSQCGEPNELGLAMEEWLQKEGF